MTDKSIFSRIAAGEVPADILHRDEHCFVIADRSPQAPVHLLIIPLQQIERLADARDEHRQLLGHLLLVAGEMARRHNVADAYRIVINNGAGAGQTVFHLHLHLLAGRGMAEQSLAD